MLEISKHSMVTLKYDLRFDNENGEVIESTTDEQPLKFLYGAGTMLPKFESHLAGLKQGDLFTISLASVDAYGEVNQDAIVELPKHIFLVDGKFDEKLIAAGNNVPMMSTNGQRLNGIVLEVNDDNVKMDFNHPLAGEDLYFSGKVIEVRKASDEELAEVLGNNDCNSEGGCSECGCGC